MVSYMAGYSFFKTQVPISLSLYQKSFLGWMINVRSFVLALGSVPIYGIGNFLTFDIGN